MKKKTDWVVEGFDVILEMFKEEPPSGIAMGVLSFVAWGVFCFCFGSKELFFNWTWYITGFFLFYVITFNIVWILICSPVLIKRLLYKYVFKIGVNNESNN